MVKNCFIIIICTFCFSFVGYTYTDVQNKYNKLKKNYSKKLKNKIATQRLINSFDNLEVEIDIIKIELFDTLDKDYFESEEVKKLDELRFKIISVRNFILVVSGCCQMNSDITTIQLEKATSELEETYEILESSQEKVEIRKYKLQGINQTVLIAVNKTLEKRITLMSERIAEKKGIETFLRHQFSIASSWSYYFIDFNDNFSQKRVVESSISIIK